MVPTNTCIQRHRKSSFCTTRYLYKALCGDQPIFHFPSPLYCNVRRQNPLQKRSLQTSVNAWCVAWKFCGLETSLSKFILATRNGKPTILPSGMFVRARKWHRPLSSFIQSSESEGDRPTFASQEQAYLFLNDVQACDSTINSEMWAENEVNCANFEMWIRTSWVTVRHSWACNGESNCRIWTRIWTANPVLIVRGRQVSASFWEET